MADELSVGDVVSMATDKDGKPVYFRVEAAESEPGGIRMWKLSEPFVDSECTERFVSTRRVTK